jgi:hypothetical protein
MPDEQQQKKKVRVACKLPGGLLIYKKSIGYDDGTGDGVKQMGGHDGPGIRLNGPATSRDAGGIGRPGGGTNDPEGENAPFGITEIDGDWRFDNWLEQNQRNPMVERGLIYELKDNDPEHPELARLEDRSPNAIA